MSPISNKEQRKKFEEEGDFISGNIFKASISTEGYLSLLKSVQVTGKKKHLKKLVAHMNHYLPASQVDDRI